MRVLATVASISSLLLPSNALAQESRVDCATLMSAALEAQARAVVQQLIQGKLDAPQAEQWLGVLIPWQCQDTPENVSSRLAAERTLWKVQSTASGAFDAQ
jgi:hypothetical protein